MVKPRYAIHGHRHLNQVTRMWVTLVIGVQGHRLLEIACERLWAPPPAPVHRGRA